MTTVVLDVETTISMRVNGTKDFSPYNENNKLVSIGWATLTDGVPLAIDDVKYVVVDHEAGADEDAIAKCDELKRDLLNSNIIVCHNAKFDTAWMAEAGFPISHLVIHDTMLIEYVLQRGIKRSLSLDALSQKYNVEYKKADHLSSHLSIEGNSTWNMPRGLLVEYGKYDILATAGVYQAQQQRVKEKNYEKLQATVNLTNEFCAVLRDIEAPGIAIDMDALESVKKKFTEEHTQLVNECTLVCKQLMGDTVVNLDSPQQLSQVIYSHYIPEENYAKWISTFNIGKDNRNKPLRRPRMELGELKANIRSMVKPVHKTRAHQCEVCRGYGKTFKTRKDGQPYARGNICKACTGAGVIYESTRELAGFGLFPLSVEYPNEHGFSTAKRHLEALIPFAIKLGKPEAAEFLKKVIRISALSAYLSNFVAGTEAAVLSNHILHPNFNQAVTTTGRLSSSNPNMQNMPRDKTFPFRQVFVSKFEGGYLVSTDFSQLEFRAAVSLAECPDGKQDILMGKDIHTQTMQTLVDAGESVDRTGAKQHTFKPLYGGKSGTAAQVTYYNKFLDEYYPTIGKKHAKWKEEALQTRMVELPTGRQYSFPYVERYRSGTISHGTMIVNYPVQGFATADIVPMAIIRLHSEYKKLGLKSHLVLTVHDDVVTDTHPDELNIVLDINKKLAYYAEEELKRRCGYEMFVPLACEVKLGKNLMNLTKVA